MGRFVVGRLLVNEIQLSVSASCKGRIVTFPQLKFFLQIGIVVEKFHCRRFKGIIAEALFLGKDTIKEIPGKI